MLRSFWATLYILLSICYCYCSHKAFATFTAFTGEPLTPDIAFTTVALVFQIATPLFMLPVVINFSVNCFISCRRLDKYILAPEIERTDDGREAALRNGDGGNYEVNLLFMLISLLPVAYVGFFQGGRGGGVNIACMP